MRNTNLNVAEIHDKDFEVIELGNIQPFEIEEFDLNDPKEFSKYIKQIKNICRNSFEYRELIKFLRENMDMNSCSFFENVNNIDTFKIKIEIHHHPFTLEDIVLIVYNKRVYFGESLESELVAKEVMYLHYLLLVGLIPLSETVHELVHNNYLFIPMDKVMGNVSEFINMYERFMTPEQLDVLENNINMSKAYLEGAHKDILATHHIYIDTSGSYTLPTYQEIIDLMNENIKRIQENPLDCGLKSPFVKCDI